MALFDRFRRRKKGGGGEEKKPPSQPPAADIEGEIVFADNGRGMLNTSTGLALNFSTGECRGFTPKARNVVAIRRIEGMNAFGLTLVADQRIFVSPEVSETDVDALLAMGAEPVLQKPLSTSALTARLPKIDWQSVFSEVNRKEPGLDAVALVQALADLQRPFDRAEIREMLSVDADAKRIENALAAIEDRWPISWLSFLSWSNGGDFSTGDRNFQDMFSLAMVREYTTSCGIPTFLPGAIPFAMDGGGGFFLFDTRAPPTEGEYPTAFCDGSEMGGGWDAVRRLEVSFLECCKQTPK